MHDDIPFWKEIQMKSLVALVGTKFRGEEMVRLLAALPQGSPSR